MKDQSFAEATSAEDFGNLKADGILGLGFSQNKLVTIIDNMKHQGLIEKRVFSFYLKPVNDEKNYFPNQFTLGDYDERLIQNEKSLVYCKVTHSFRWAVDLISISLQKDSENEKLFFSSRTKALIDSGTSLNAFSREAINNLWKLFKKKGINCNLSKGLMMCNEKNLENYPNILINLCGNNMILNPIDYIQIYEEFSLVLIQSIDLDEDLIILGDVFMRKYYTIFDLDEKKIGFGLANQGLNKSITWNWNLQIRLIFLIWIKLLLFFFIIF